MPIGSTAKITVQPALEASRLDWRARRPEAASILAAGPYIDTASGTSAIAHALRAIGLRAGDSVLVPAYHCPSMIEPIVHCGATPVFCPITDRLELDPDVVATVIGPTVRAMIIPHYFGLRQDLRRFRSSAIPIIEDCAHAWFGGSMDEPIGSQGDFAIASMPKFFPVLRGGILVSREHPLPRLPRLEMRAELKHLVNLLECAAETGHGGRAARAIRAVNGRRGAAPHIRHSTPPEAADERAEPWKQGPRYLNDSDLARDSGTVARVIMRHSNVPELIRARRSNYASVAKLIGRARRARTFWDTLPDSVAVPYVVPVWLDDPTRDYSRLRERGICLFRWDETLRGKCAVSDDFATHLVQFPCHQGLRARDLVALGSAIEDVLR